MVIRSVYGCGLKQRVGWFSAVAHSDSLPAGRGLAFSALHFNFADGSRHKSPESFVLVHKLSKISFTRRLPALRIVANPSQCIPWRHHPARRVHGSDVPTRVSIPLATGL